MNAVLEFLSEHGQQLALGVTAILAAGLFFVLIVRQPVFKQKISELSVAAAMLWLGLAVFPFDRSHNVERSVSPSNPENIHPVALPASSPEPSIQPNVAKIASRNAPALTHSDVAMSADDIARLLSNREPPKVAPVVRLAGNQSSSEPPAVATSTPSIRWIPIGVFGVFFASLFALAMAKCRLWLIVSRSKSPERATLETWQSLNPPKKCRLLVSRRETMPMSFGLARPTVVISESLTQGNSETLSAVMRHELAHVRHGDVWGRTAFNLALPFLSLHPLYWLLRREAAFAAELRADAAAAASNGASGYVASLLDLFNRTGRPRRRLAASSLFTSQSAFSRRMTMLLERKGELKERTPRLWMPTAFGAAAIGAALLANHFGIAYAQVSKERLDGERKSVDQRLDRFVSQTQAKTKNAEPGAKSATVDFTVDPTQHGSADAVRSGISVGDALALQIADKKAKLAALKYSGRGNEMNTLPLEIEVVQLESARRSALKDYELQSVERRLLDLASETEEAAVTLGKNHPDQQKLERLLAGLQKRREMLMRMIEEEGARTEQTIRAMAEQIVRADALPAKQATKSSNAGPQKALAMALDRIAKLEAENKQLLASRDSVVAKHVALQNTLAMTRDELSHAKSTTPATPASSFEASLPMIRHRLRMAEAEPEALQSRLKMADMSYERVAKLHKTGVISVEEVAKAEAAVTEAHAALRKNEVEIASLKTLLKELEESKSTKADAFNKATGVAR